MTTSNFWFGQGNFSILIQLSDTFIPIETTSLMQMKTYFPKKRPWTRSGTFPRSWAVSACQSTPPWAIMTLFLRIRSLIRVSSVSWWSSTQFPTPDSWTEYYSLVSEIWRESFLSNQDIQIWQDFEENGGDTTPSSPLCRFNCLLKEDFMSPNWLRVSPCWAWTPTSGTSPTNMCRTWRTPRASSVGWRASSGTVRGRGGPSSSSATSHRASSRGSTRCVGSTRGATLTEGTRDFTGWGQTSKMLAIYLLKLIKLRIRKNIFESHILSVNGSIGGKVDWC